MTAKDVSVTFGVKGIPGDGPSAAAEEGGSADWGIVQDGNRGGQWQGLLG